MPATKAQVRAAKVRLLAVRALQALRPGLDGPENTQLTKVIDKVEHLWRRAERAVRDANEVSP